MSAVYLMVMGKVLAIDHGTKRMGLAITDEARIIATGLDTVPASDIKRVLHEIFGRENVDTIVVGLPLRLNTAESDATKRVREVVRFLEKEFRGKEIVTYDERFTSKIAERTMLATGSKKKQRQQKGKLDMISATVLLQDYLASVS